MENNRSDNRRRHRILVIDDDPVARDGDPQAQSFVDEDRSIHDLQQMKDVFHLLEQSVKEHSDISEDAQHCSPVSYKENRLYQTLQLFHTTTPEVPTSRMPLVWGIPCISALRDFFANGGP